jgi:hypothetical protein
MQPWVATLISAGVVILINLATAAYVYGKLTQRVVTLEENDERQERRLNAHSTELNGQGQRLATVEGQLKHKPAR